MTNETSLRRLERIIARGMGNKLPIRTIAKLVRTEVEMQVSEKQKTKSNKEQRK